MRIKSIVLVSVGSLAVVACAPPPPPPVASAPPPPGAVSGSTAADRDGDGIVDGYYTSDGMYHPYTPPAPPPPPPPPVSPSGERG